MQIIKLHFDNMIRHFELYRLTCLLYWCPRTAEPSEFSNGRFSTPWHMGQSLSFRLFRSKTTPQFLQTRITLTILTS